MEKWMSLATIGVAGLLLVAFALDLALRIPFGGLSPFVDILSVLAAAIVAYLGWESYRDVK